MILTSGFGFGDSNVDIVVAASGDALPANWVERSHGGRIYYVNTHTKQRTGNRPNADMAGPGTAVSDTAGPPPQAQQLQSTIDDLFDEIHEDDYAFAAGLVASEESIRRSANAGPDESSCRICGSILLGGEDTGTCGQVFRHHNLRCPQITANGGI